MLQEAEKQNFEIEIVTPEILLKNLENNIVPDAIFPRMWAYTPLFVMDVLSEFEKKWVYVVNWSENVRNFSDKKKTYELLQHADILIPKVLKRAEVRESCFPLICKKRFSVWGKDVFLFQNLQDFHTFLTECEKPQDYVFQEAIQESFWRDIRVVMWREKNIVTYQRIAQNWEFRANFSLGAELLLSEFDEKISKIATKVMHQFSLDFVGIDLLFDGKKYFVCEINTAPGFLWSESVSQKNIVWEVFDEIIKKAQKK